MEQPRLVDGDVVLRALRAADLDALVARCQDPELAPWTGVPPPYSRDEAAACLDRIRHGRQDDRGVFAVDLDGRAAGQVTVRPDGRGAGDVGYLLEPWARGRGAASRALRLAVRWAFEDAGLEVLHWRCPVGSWAARRVAWACGFLVEGRVRGLVAAPAGRQDAWVGSLGRGDPLQPVTRWLALPRLESASVVLRANRADDAERVVEACSDPQTQQYLPELPSPYTEQDARWYLDSRPEQHAAGQGLYWAVADPHDDRLLAQIGLMGLSERSRSGEIGYWAHPQARGTGVVTTAVRLVARHALLPAAEGGVGLGRVHLRVAAGNEASARVARRAGFVEVGRDRRAERLRDGTVVDFVRFDLLPEEMERGWVHPSALR